MSDLATIGGAVIALSACTSGVCVAVAYHVPARLRDGWNAAAALLQGDDTDDTPADDPGIKPPAV
jgi:hypothetical protein